MDNVSIVCNGTRVIGLGNIGTEGAIPVMEGKSYFVQNTWWYKRTSIMYSQDIESNNSSCRSIQPIFGGLNIEDIQSSSQVLETI